MPNPLRYAVFGHPIGHSRSPAIHAAFGQQCGVVLDYQAIDAPPDQFTEMAGRFFAKGGQGANVTLPYKADALALAHEASDAARRAGSANTLTSLGGGRLRADNTDGSGLVRDLAQRHGVRLAGARVLLLGAGGAARGVAWPLLASGVDELCIANRTEATARALAQSSGDERVWVHPWSALDALPAFDLVLHATAAGTLGQPLTLPAGLVGEHSVAYDLAYGAAAAPFLTWARVAGAGRAIDGLGMLVEQAADAFLLWHGVRPPTDAVYAQLR